MYSGVPLMLVTSSVAQDSARAKPKSHSFTTPPAPACRMHAMCPGESLRMQEA
jgi:hypothetical protein